MASKTNIQTENTPQTREPKKRSNWVLLLILLLLLLTFLIQWRLSQSKSLKDTEDTELILLTDSMAILDSLRVLDSLMRQDSTRHADSLSRLDSLARLDSLHAAQNVDQQTIGGTQGRASGTWDAAKGSSSVPSISSVKGSSSSEVLSMSSSDTLPPLLEVEPVSGRYNDQVSLKVTCIDYVMKDGKKSTSLDCDVFKVPRDFQSDEIPKEAPIIESQKLTQDTEMTLVARDAAGNLSPPIYRQFKIVPRTSTCGKSSVPVGGVIGEGPQKGFCVDQYEWPNQKGEKPKTFMSQAEAVEACLSINKRLCTASEWKMACEGPNQTLYPYGSSFEASYCVSSSKSAGRAGRKKNCRSWYGAYDMGGNVWEWTSTPSPKRKKYFVVSGGSWKSVNQTSCGTTKYSFFPQNQYPMVGFRCCSDQK